MEFIGSVMYPSTADASGVPLKGPFPLIVFLHGRHSPSYNLADQSTSMAWPPGAGQAAIPSYEGYDYASSVLASHGYVVISISADGVNARDNMTPDRGMLVRAQLIQAHLDFWKQLDTTGQATPDATGFSFGTKFVGVVNMSNIGTMGHSRGGEGVMRSAVFNSDPVLNPEAKNGPAYAIRAVLPIAPVDYNRFIVNNIPFAVILPYCDGDVNDNQGMHFYDDARYNVPGDGTPKFFMDVMGGNHNYFNTIWTPGVFAGGVDDWTYNAGFDLDPYGYAQAPHTGRLTPAGQRAVGLFYMLTFFRAYIGGETQFVPYLQGELPPPPSAQGALLQFTYHAPAGARLDVNRFQTPDALMTDALNGAVHEAGLTPFDVQGSGVAPEGKSPIPGQPAARQPANTPSLYAPMAPGLSQLRLGWSAPGAFLEDDIPAAFGDVHAFTALQFRAAVNFVDYRNTVAQDDFSVVLTDSSGKSASVPVSSDMLYAAAVKYPPGRVLKLPKVVLNMVRLPLSAFTGVDLAHLASVKLVFDRQPKGALLLTDLAFAN